MPRLHRGFKIVDKFPPDLMIFLRDRRRRSRFPFMRNQAPGNFEVFMLRRESFCSGKVSVLLIR